jgi:hypothetical protein
MDPTSPPTARTRSNKATVALVLAIASVLTGPLLLMAQIIALFGLATVSEEPSNPIGYTLVVLAIFVLLALLTFALPITALVLGARSRREINRSSGTLRGGAIAVTAQVLAAVVIAALCAGAIFIILRGSGLCSLDFCQ